MSLEPGAVRLSRLNAGAPFLDSHCSYQLSNVIGSVVPGSAKIENGLGVATIKLSKAPGVADTVQKISEGVIRNISVGYWQHKIVKTEGDDGTVARWDIVDWEPLEVSAVPIPADAGSQIRSADNQTKDGLAMRSCVLVMNSKTPVSGPSATARKEDPVALKEANADEQKRRLAALRDMDSDDTAEKVDERDQEDADGEMDADGADSDDDKNDDDSRDAADGDVEEKEKDDKGDRSAIVEVAKCAAEAAVKAERVRSTEIAEIASQFKLTELGKRHIAKGTSVRVFKDAVLKRLAETQAKRGDASLAAAAVTEVSGDSGTAGTISSDTRKRAHDEAAAYARKLLGKKA